MFSGASNFADSVDSVFLFIFTISFIFLFGLTGIMVWFAVKYNRKRHPKAVQIKDNMKLELAWTIIPLILVLFMFYYGYMAFAPTRVVPKDAMPVRVTGQMWSWSFEYPNGKKTTELRLPLNKPVKLLLYSPDVIHSFYIPAFRIKEDMVPGKENYMWFVPTIEGTYEILCAEYCGLSHAFMEAKVVVVQDTSFNRWLNEVVPMTAQELGLTILQNNACTGCHSLDGKPLIGPSFKGLFGSKRVVVVNGKETTVVADSAYIKRAILEPNQEVVKGFKPEIMRSYKDVLKANDIKSIVDYLEQDSKAKN
jgi:cytochrome c oxidase subunit 2